MTASAPRTEKARAGRQVAVLRGRSGSLLGLRLTRVRNVNAVFRAATPPEFWSAVHQAGLTLSVRWIVFPSSTVGPPGHLELYVLGRVESDRPPLSMPHELCSLMALGFPQHGFEPITAEDELLFALAPFGEWAWCLALGRPEAPPEPRPVGFGRVDDGCGPRDSDSLFHFVPAQADPAQAVFVLASCPVASMLEWTLTPSELPDGERNRLAKLAVRAPEDRPTAPLAFDCQVLWSGSSSPAPTLLGASVAQALGVRDGGFGPITRAPVREVLSGSFMLADRARPSRLLVAHTSLPGLLPSPDALAAVAPTLRSPVRPRLPEADLPDEGAPFGRTFDGRVARLSVPDRLRHVWILGQTGTGKSTLLLNRILQDLEEGHGVAVFDPHGELVADIQRRLPASRREEVVSVDVADHRHEPPVLNLLECRDIASAHMRAGQVVELITSLWPRDYCGPIWQQASMHGLLLLAARFEEPGTIADLPRLFLDDDFRRSWLRSPRLTDRVPQAAAWWTESYAKYTAQSRSESLDYYISKFNLFFTDPVLRATLGQSRSTVDLRQLMDQRGVLLCNLARNGVNPMATTLLTGVFMQSALNAALARGDLPADRRAPFFVYCDEFQRIVGPSTGAILSEVRKYGLGLVLAHQFVDQLPEDTLAAVLGNVGTKLVFRVGARDAQRIVGYQPSLTVAELIRMPNFTAIAEALLGGVPSAPFTLYTPPAPAEPPEAPAMPATTRRFRWPPLPPPTEAVQAAPSRPDPAEPPPTPRTAPAGTKTMLTFHIYRGGELVRSERLAQEIVKVGRLASSHLRIDDEKVSRMHAIIEVSGPEEICITDLGSANGIVVNGQKVDKCGLRSGDEIKFGDTVVLLHLDGSAGVVVS